MASKRTIGTLVFGGGESTLGIDIVCDSIEKALPDIDIVRNVDMQTAKEVDYLLVSLYWWKDVYAHIRFLGEAGIDPRKRSPVIIIGGMSAINPFVLHGYYNYAVIGDGEITAPALLAELIKDNFDVKIDGIVSDGDDGGCFSEHAKLQAQHYVELRTNKTVRIEIARGCKFRCPFCELAVIKPYRELPYEIVRHLILTAPTKNVALFAPDRASHSRYMDIETCIAKAGKRNTGNDIRLDTIKRQSVATTLRFGIEAFTENKRKRMKGMKSTSDLIEYFRHIFENIKTAKGNPITTATAYMIADLPGERSLDAIKEFSDTLMEIDAICPRKFTLFLSVAGFMPSPYTRMERDDIDPYTNFNDLWKRHRARTKNIVIATRGAVIGPTMRLAQMLTVRADERARGLMYFLSTSTQARKLLANRSAKAGKTMEGLIAKTGIDPSFIYRQLDKSEPLPSDRIVRTKWAKEADLQN
jgi:hypothetical protein